jgi:hypothetical protein
MKDRGLCKTAPTGPGNTRFNMVFCWSILIEDAILVGKYRGLCKTAPTMGDADRSNGFI